MLLLYKKEALELLNLKIDYPPSRIKEITDATGISIDEMKSQIFGKELFKT